VPPGPLEAVPSRHSRWRRWPKWILLLVLFLWIADMGISLLLQHTRLQHKLTSRLEAAFGRPVEVGSYDFSLWGGPTLEAQSVTVAEDPRFGHEYFLRAESLTIRLRWWSFLAGRLELGTLSLRRPSLNLVRNSSGDWNLGEWLPRPAGTPSQNAPIGPARPSGSVLRLSKVEIEGGRINFKNGDEKIAFALTNVKGALETESPGLWRIDLDATPSRAAVILQHAGMLHLAGHVGGTSSRLRPALLELSWQDASITDVLRLARTYDYGVHGTLSASLSARTEGDAWLLEGRAALQQLHRWDLPLRADNPSLNLIAQGKLDLSGSRFELTQATLEAPYSNAHAAGILDWNHPGKVPVGDATGTRLQITSPGIALTDVLAWLRAFHTNVAEDLSLRGSAVLSMALRGWPPRLDRGTLSINGAELEGRELRVPVHLGSAAVRYDKDVLSIAPTQLSFGASDAAFRIESSVKVGSAPASSLRVTGSVVQARDILTTAKFLGWDISRGWDFGGPLRCDLHWLGAHYPWESPPNGTLDWGGELAPGSLRAPFLNQPMEQIKAHADFKPGARHISISSAQAFGAHWTGTFDRGTPAQEWEFALAADRLSGADLDLWLNPRWRESFLDRMLPFLNPRASSNAAPETLRASGRLSLGELSLAPFVARHLNGDLTVEGRRIEFENVKGEFYGGNISGTLDAGLVAPPAYHAALQFTSVDLNALTAASPSIAGIFAGLASGEISFHARGASRTDLLASLECLGRARVAGAGFRTINLAESLREAGPRPGTSTFRDASAAFSCANRKILFRDLALSGAAADIDGAGSVDFSRNLDFRLRILPVGEGAPHVTKTSAAPAASQTFHIGGSLAAPQFARIAAKPIAQH
jgi:hypothetical protein